MTVVQERLVNRKIIIMQTVEKVGNVKKACNYFGVSRETYYLAFEDALHVFSDPMAVTRTDYLPSEERWQIIGQVFGVQVIMVVYTMRQPGGETAIKIISARKATPQERRGYENSTWFS